MIDLEQFRRRRHHRDSYYPVRGAEDDARAAMVKTRALEMEKKTKRAAASDELERKVTVLAEALTRVFEESRQEAAAETATLRAELHALRARIPPELVLDREEWSALEAAMANPAKAPDWVRKAIRGE